ncbi:2210_t:CDS:2 [Cetraspora pellucida]|uniref:2210_t:CDS:1 n=1 Tax=Cetraspora pellucida TaxID=1433469 RepID=A0A9N9CIC5_9GLOM|nr:2210_t:CDS:2 [Cetraspora pellucida]
MSVNVVFTQRAFANALHPSKVSGAPRYKEVKVVFDKEYLQMLLHHYNRVD